MVRFDAQSLWPAVVYVTPEAAEDQLTKRVLSRLKLEPVIIGESKEPIDEANGYYSDELADEAPRSESQRYSAAKHRLVLSRYKGEWLKSCPGTNQHVCCNLWVVNPGEGCPMDCTYCYLQSYLRRNPTPKLYTNVVDMLRAIELRVVAEPQRLFRICTGELIDSLIWDELTDLSLELVPLFARLPNAVLELKTKSNSIANLIAQRNEHHGKTVVSWSVNARQVAENDEALAASLAERIEAAARVAELGYRFDFAVRRWTSPRTSARAS